MENFEPIAVAKFLRGKNPVEGETIKGKFDLNNPVTQFPDYTLNSGRKDTYPTVQTVTITEVDEAAYQFVLNLGGTATYTDCFKAGAEWQAQQAKQPNQ